MGGKVAFFPSPKNRSGEVNFRAGFDRRAAEFSPRAGAVHEAVQLSPGVAQWPANGGANHRKGLLQ